jgi:hypothetical protein
MFKLDLSVPKDQPIVGVRTTNNRGFTPEELAEQCMQKVISVADTAPPGLRSRRAPSLKTLRDLWHII